MLKSGFLEKNGNGEYKLHDWEDHQPWVCHADERSQRAKEAALARWGSKSNANSMRGACETHTKRNAPSPSPIPYQDIVAYLNKKTASNFKHTSQNTKSCIKARWNEGFRFDDFKRVIDTKTDQWATDEKMVSYLRPVTLFGTKFESYLNENGPIPKKTEVV